MAHTRGAMHGLRAAVLLAALLLAALSPAAVTAAVTCPSGGLMLPSGMPVGDLKTHPAFRSKIETVMKDFLMSFMAGGNTTVPQWTGYASLSQRLLGVNPDCPVPHNGFSWTANTACGSGVQVAGVEGIQVNIDIAGNKTRCFDARMPKPKSFSLGGTVTIFPPTYNVTGVRILDNPTDMVSPQNALKASAAYCAPLGRPDTQAAQPLKEPALVLLSRYWFGTGKNATCDPDFSILSAAASDLKLVLVAACAKEEQLTGADDTTLGATTWHLKIQASKGCPKPGSPMAQLLVEIEGVVTFYERINDVTSHSLADLILPPPPPKSPPPKSPPPPKGSPPPPKKSSPPPPKRSPPPPPKRSPPPPKRSPPPPKRSPPPPKKSSPPPPKKRSPPPPKKLSPPPPKKRSPPPPKARPSPKPTTRRPIRTLLSSPLADSVQYVPGRNLLQSSVPPPSSTELITCQSSFSCVFSTLDMLNTPDNFPGLILPVGDQKVNLFKYFSPSSFANTAKYYAGQAFCDMVVKGSDLPGVAALQKSPLSWLGSLSAMGPALDFVNIFSGLPVQPDQYYLVGAFSTGIPGLAAVPGFPGPVQIAGAINQCIGDYIFGFNGLEVEITFGPEIPITATLALTTLAYSKAKKLSSDAMGIPNVYWSPTGSRTVSISGDFSASADTSIDLGLKGSVAVMINAGTTLLINTDPAGNGIGNTADFQALVDVTAGPSIELLDGQLSIDLSALASADMTLLASYISPSNFMFAFRATGSLSLESFLNTIPEMPGAVAKYVGMMYPSASGSINLWIDQSTWGLMMDFTGNYGNSLNATASALSKYTTHFKGLGDVFNQILTYVPGFDTALSGGFSISGSMTGNGLPIKASYYSGSASGTAKLGIYFCDRDSQCPGNALCSLNVCYTFACPSGTSINGLLCYAPCRAGYTNVLGVCWKNCPSGWTDTGVACVSPGNCPSGQENVGGICYANCNSGYYSVASVCWSRCPDGYDDIGALCSRGAITRGKGCCCISQLKCKGFVKCSWKKSCCDNCDSGFSDTGCTCFRSAATVAKSSYVRSPLGSPFTITAKDSYVISPVVPNFKIPGTSF